MDSVTARENKKLTDITTLQPITIKTHSLVAETNIQNTFIKAKIHTYLLWPQKQQYKDITDFTTNI